MEEKTYTTDELSDVSVEIAGSVVDLINVFLSLDIKREKNTARNLIKDLANHRQIQLLEKLNNIANLNNSTKRALHKIIDLVDDTSFHSDKSIDDRVPDFFKGIKGIQFELTESIAEFKKHHDGIGESQLSFFVDKSG